MKNGFIIGLDLNEFEAQVCRYNEETKEAVSAMVTVGGSMASFPAHLSYYSRDNRWNYGIEADYFAMQKGAFLIDNVLEGCCADQVYELEDRELPASEMLARFIKCALTVVGIIDPAEEIRAFALSVPEVSLKLSKVVKEAFAFLGIEGRGYLQDHTESFAYHTLYQDPEVFNKRVGLFAFPEDGSVKFVSLQVNYTTKPLTVLPSDKKSASLPEEAKLRDAAFMNFASDAMKDDEYSGIFLVGRGFDKNWSKESLAFLCRSHRLVYNGDNLFAKGACYGALEKTADRKLANFLYLGQDVVYRNIGMDMVVRGVPEYHPFVTAGVHWYDVAAKADVLLNGEDKLVFHVSSMYDGSRKSVQMALPGLPARPPKTSRIRIRVTFRSADECIIEAEDLGFGEIYRSSGLKWSEQL